MRDFLYIEDVVDLYIQIAESLSKDKKTSVRVSVAQNQYTPVSLLEKLADDEDEEVYLTVSQNENTPVSLMEKLKDKSEVVRMYLAADTVSASELEKLAVDESEIVRQSVAGNNNITISLLEKLVDDEDEWVRNNVAYNRITGKRRPHLL